MNKWFVCAYFKSEKKKMIWNFVIWSWKVCVSWIKGIEIVSLQKVFRYLFVYRIIKLEKMYSFTRFIFIFQGTKIAKFLGDEPGLTFAGSNVNLTITTECLSLMVMESGEVSHSDLFSLQVFHWVTHIFVFGEGWPLNMGKEMSKFII